MTRARKSRIGLQLGLLGLGALVLFGVFLATRSHDRDSAGAEPEPVDHLEEDEVGDEQERELASRAAEDRPLPLGRWRRASSRVDEEALTPEQRERIEELEAIGYVSGSEPAPDRSGVTVHSVGRAYEGLNLYTSGHAATALLVDMDGRVLHTWRADFERVWPEDRVRGPKRSLTRFWRRAYLYANGDLLAIFDAHSLVKLDKDSNVLWKVRCGAHHDLEVLPDGTVLVLTSEVHVVREFNEREVVREDFVSLLAPDGTEKQRFSLLEALDLSSFEELKERARKREGDILHTNSLSVLDGRRADEIPAFRAGNLLISSRPLDFIAVVDPELRQIVWTLQGTFREQHDPKLLDNGNLLLFDNTGRGEASTVLELDPVTGATVWEYRGSAQAPFYSSTCGTAERLPNGNTLITESDAGRAFEVTSAGEIVWEFWNPARAGEENEYIATLFEVVRLPLDYPKDWLR